MATTDPPVLARMSLLGLDANAFAIIGAVRTGLRRAGATPEQVEQFTTEAMSADYVHVVSTAIRWTTVEAPDADEDA